MRTTLAFLFAVALFGFAFGYFGDTNVAEFPDEQQSSFSDESDVALGNEDLTTSSDNEVSAQLFNTITCQNCMCTKPNIYGQSSVAVCLKCCDKIKPKPIKYRICYNCFCCSKCFPRSRWPHAYAFCRKCLK